MHLHWYNKGISYEDTRWDTERPKHHPKDTRLTLGQSLPGNMAESTM